MTDYITTKEAAKILGVTVDWVGQLCNQGILKAEKPGRDWQVSRQSVMGYKAKVEAGKIKPGRPRNETTSQN